MLLVGKDKRKLAVHKGKGWNREIKFEPVLVFGTYEGFGNTEIKLWKPISNGKFKEVRNDHKRKHKKTLNLLKKRGKSLTITAPQGTKIKGRLAINRRSNVIGYKKSNQVELINYSSPNSKIFNSIKDSHEEEKHLFKPYFSSNYGNGNKEYKTQAQFVTGSDTLKYSENKQMPLKPIIQNLFTPNLIEYSRHIEGGSSGFKSHFSTDHLNQNEGFVNSPIITKCETLNYIPDTLIDSNLNNKSNSEKLFPCPVNEFASDNGEKKLFVSDTTSNNIGYASNGFITESETLKNIPDELLELNLNNKSNSEKLFASPVNEFASDNAEKKLFLSNTSSDYKEYTTNLFIAEPETLQFIPDELMVSNLKNKSNSEKLFPSPVNEFASDDAEKKLFVSDTTSNYIVYGSNGFITKSETLKNISDELIDLNLNNKSNSEKFVHNAVIEIASNKIDKMFSSNISSNYREYTSNQFIVEPETLQFIPDELVKSVVNEFPSNNKFYIDTSQCTTPHPSTFMSLEELASKSYDSYQNIRESWSLDSSKVLMTPSKRSVKSDGPSTSEGCELIKPDENANTRESTCKAFNQLLDSLDANLNVIIDDHQLKDQTILKLQDEKDSNINYYALKSQDQAMVQLQNSVNDYQNNNQTMKMVKDNNLNDNHLSNNTYIKFTVLKKYQKNEETLLDSSEDIENNIFFRNKISPCFENSISNSYTRKYRKEKQMLLEKCETDNDVRSKNDSFADILHEQLSKNNDLIHFETRSQVPKDPQQSTEQMINIENFNCLNNFTDQSTKHLFNNEIIHASNEIFQKSSKGGSMNAMSFKNSDDDEKARVLSLSSITSSQKYYNEVSECTKSLATTLIEIETTDIEEMMEHSLEQTLGETSVKINRTDDDKMSGANEDFYNYFLESNKANHSNLNTDSKKKIQNITNEPDDELLYNLVSKSNNSIKNSDKDYPEIEKCTNEITCNIITVRTEDDLLLLAKPEQKLPEKERIKKNNTEETLNRMFPEPRRLEEKGPKPLYNEELHFLLVPERNSALDSNFNDQIDNIFKNYEKEKSDKAILNEKFTLVNSSLENSSTNLQSIATSSHLVKGENELLENFKLISDKKEKSCLIMNLELNEMQRTVLEHDSIISGSLPNEKSMSAREKNVQNTNLYFMKHQVNSPYHNSQSKQNMIVNFENARKKSIQDKFFSCFRKLNFLAKRKSTASLSRTDKSNF